MLAAEDLHLHRCTAQIFLLYLMALFHFKKLWVVGEAFPPPEGSSDFGGPGAHRRLFSHCKRDVPVHPTRSRAAPPAFSEATTTSALHSCLCAETERGMRCQCLLPSSSALVCVLTPAGCACCSCSCSASAESCLFVLFLTYFLFIPLFFSAGG